MNVAPSSSPAIVRRAVRIEGVVQGVGFRPAMARLARLLNVTGCIKSDGRGISLEVEGPTHAVSRFLFEIPKRAPAAARIDFVEHFTIDARGDDGFVILDSSAGKEVGLVSCAIPADLPPCDACSVELRDPHDRHRRHAFIACSACGPRFSVVRALPYDRATTAMHAFAPCAACARDAGDVANRRFRAEGVACPRCGPRLTFSARIDDTGEVEGDDALTAAVRAVRDGSIVAVTGTGGFSLTCDATNDAAVKRLRSAIGRDEPFAVMARDLDQVERIALLSETERRTLTSTARPIVLVTSLPDGPVSAAVAPGLREIGVLLPPTPLQLLLMLEGPPLQVTTSFVDGVADAFLLHDREIVRRVDDSIVRVIARRAVPIRRSRGFVPELLALPAPGPGLLAVGGDRKNTVCLARDGHALVSQHIGDLDDELGSFLDVIDDLEKLFAVEPEAVAHDLNPDYRGTRLAGALGLPRVAVQHHHAHVASCLADNGKSGPAIGVIFDGTGMGDDGTLWGGEIFLADLVSYERLGHLRPLPLQSARDPWRLALAALADAGEPVTAALFGGARAEELLKRQTSSRSSTPATGAGLWFDAVASLCGLCDVATYDGQAALLLEEAALPGPAHSYNFTLVDEPKFVIDLRPTVCAIARDLRARVDIRAISAAFHETLAQIVLHACRRAREAGAPALAALSGGCFQNRRLTERSRALLEDDGFEVLTHRRIPPNDGGLSLGQAAVASARLG